MTKRRPSKLDAHQADLLEWFGEQRISLAEAQARLAQRGCKIGIGRLSVWWQARQREQMEAQLIERIATGSALHSKLNDAFDKSPAPGMDLLSSLLKSLIMKLAIQGETNPDHLNLLPQLLRPVIDNIKVQQKERELDLATDKLAWMKQRAEQADKTDAVLADRELTDDQRRQRIAEIYGRA